MSRVDRVVERAFDALGRPCHAFLDRQARILLTAQCAAVARANPHRQIDGPLLPLDLPYVVRRDRGA